MNINITASGRIKIYKRIQGSDNFELTSSNAILPLFIDMIAKRLGDLPDSKVQSISLVLGGINPSVVAPISEVTRSDFGEVTFKGHIGETVEDFEFHSMTLDTPYGPIARVEGLNQTKLAGESLRLVWIISIDSCN